MGKYRITEDNLKNDMYNAYSDFYNETSSDRRQKHFERFYDKVFQWYTIYLFNEEELCSFALWNALIRVVKKERKEENEFFPYLRKTLENVRNEYLRDEGWIPREKKEEFKDIRKFLDKLERESERKLSNLEKAQKISLYRQISEEKAWKLMDEMEMGKIVSLDKKTSEDIGNMYSLTSSEKALDSQSEYIAKVDGQILCNAIESTINSKQERTRKCTMALFTLYCYDKEIHFDEIIPVLDEEIWELCTINDKKPTQKEIYMKYHPNTKSTSAEASASDSLKDFLVDLNNCLKK